MFDGVLDETRFGFYNIEAAFIKKSTRNPILRRHTVSPKQLRFEASFIPQNAWGTVEFLNFIRQFELNISFDLFMQSIEEMHCQNIKLNEYY
jgi:hypothetical protein